MPGNMDEKKKAAEGKNQKHTATKEVAGLGLLVALQLI
jgi:hypothetical protein